MAKVWFSRGDKLHDPVCQVDAERSADIPTVRAAPSPLPKHNAAYRHAPAKAPQSVRKSAARELPHWLDPTESSTVPWVPTRPEQVSPKPTPPKLSELAHQLASEKARRNIHPTNVKIAQQWVADEADTAILTPLWMQQTLPRIPADWRERLAAGRRAENDITLEPIDSFEPSIAPHSKVSAPADRDVRQRIPYPARVSPSIDIPIDRSGHSDLPTVRSRSQVGVGMMVVILLNISLFVGLFGAVFAIAAPDALQRFDAQAILRCWSLDPACVSSSQVHPVEPATPEP